MKQEADTLRTTCVFRQHDRSEQEETTDAPESDQVIRLDRMIRSDQTKSNKTKSDQTVLLKVADSTDPEYQGCVNDHRQLVQFEIGQTVATQISHR